MSDPPLTLGALLRESAASAGEIDALVFPDGRQSHADLNRSSRRWAAALIALGVKPGEHVGILLTTRPEFVELVFGIAMAGAVAVPVNARYQPAELAYLIKDADLVALATTGKVADSLDFSERLYGALPSLRTAPSPHALSLPEAPKLRQILCIDEPCGPGLLAAAAALDSGANVDETEIDRRIDATDPQSIGLIL